MYELCVRFVLKDKRFIYLGSLPANDNSTQVSFNRENNILYTLVLLAGESSHSLRSASDHKCLLFLLDIFNRKTVLVRTNYNIFIDAII